MGIHVHLSINPRDISASDWESTFAETLSLLSAWQPALLALNHRELYGVKLPVYTRSLLRNEGTAKECWRVVGDRQSMRMGETHELARHLKRYGEGVETPGGDLVAWAASPEREYTDGPATVLSNKTQGYPYHLALLAAAMLVEERFPLAAMVSGNITRAQAEVAQRLAAPLLGRELPLPVRVDAPQLAERLSRVYTGGELPAAFQRVFVGAPYDSIEATLRQFPGEAASKAWLRDLAAFRADQHGATRLLVAWLNSGRSIADAARWACNHPEGPGYSQEDFARLIGSAWTLLSPTAQRALAPFERPKGAPETIPSLMSRRLLDQLGAGRHLRVQPAAAQVEAALSEGFGESQTQALMRIVRDRTTFFEAALSKAKPTLERIRKQAEQARDVDTEVLIRVASHRELGPLQRMFVHAIAFGATKTLRRLKQGSKADLDFANAAQLRSAIARVALSSQLFLTEELWDRVDAETDTDVLAFILALASQRLSELPLSETRRAVLENPELFRYALEAANNPKIIRRMEFLASLGGTLEG